MLPKCSHSDPGWDPDNPSTGKPEKTIIFLGRGGSREESVDPEPGRNPWKINGKWNTIHLLDQITSKVSRQDGSKV